MLPEGLIRFGFRLLYNELAFSYDVVAWLVSFGQWAAWRRTVTLFLKEGAILELAHGTGGLLTDLNAAGRTSVGLDVSAAMGRLARRRLLQRGLPLRLVRARAQALPFRDAAFANVIATFPTDFILELETLAEARRVLQPNGRLVVVVMGVLRGPRLLRDVLEWANRITGQRHLPERDPLLTLEAAGFNASWQTVSLQGATAHLLVGTCRGLGTPGAHDSEVRGCP